MRYDDEQRTLDSELTFDDFPLHHRRCLDSLSHRRNEDLLMTCKSCNIGSLVLMPSTGNYVCNNCLRETKDVEPYKSKDAQPTIEEWLKELTETISKALPQNWGFALYMIEFGGKEVNKNIYFAATIKKSDVIQFLRAWLEVNKEQ